MSDIRWQKSSFSTETADCIEIARVAGVAHLRESDTPHVIATAGRVGLRALVRGVKRGALDLNLG
ncbi:DUF397 domain-containing protein [Streptoverticillium reticulum]|uniref:DUF397 domain-containing protein n=1 Tax=Streptoverticillium reticulum TaxID=1433415 RepID=UPI0039BF4A32